MKQKLTVTIGIPAHNEEANIKQLIVKLLSQSEKLYALNEIIVYSDASTDNTIINAKSINDSRVKVVANKRRQGKNSVQNRLFKKANSDVLVIFDADVIPQNSQVLNSLVKPFLNEPKTVIVSGGVVPTKPSNLVSEVLAFSQIIKSKIYENFLETNPVYLCNGRIMAYAKSFYKKTEIPPKLLSDDAYLSLLAIANGQKITYQKSATVVYQPPTSVRDHVKQSTRFFTGKSQLIKVFGKSFIEKQYSLPLVPMLICSIKSFVQNPKHSFLYILLLGVCRLKAALPQKVVHSFWETAKSSKKLINKYV